MRNKIFVLVFCMIFLIGIASAYGLGSKVLQGVNSLSDEEISGLILDGIEIQDFDNYLEINFLSYGLVPPYLGGWPDFLEEFYFISPLSNSNHSTFIKINKESEEIFEADFTVKENSDFDLGGLQDIYVPKDSRLKFYEGVIKLEVADNATFESTPNILDPDYWTNSLEIEGKNVKISDDLTLVDGKMNYGVNGYGVMEGYANYKQNLLKVFPPEGGVLVANSKLEDYGGNWIYQEGDNFLLKSSPDGRTRVEILEGHEIFNTDRKDYLLLSSSWGSEITAQSRENEGLVPLVNVKNSEYSFSSIENDGLYFNSVEGKYKASIGYMPTRKSDFEEPYQSVAMELIPDSIISEKIVINSYRQFNVLGKENSELVTFNKYDLPVSKAIIDNSMQDINLLREKYPNIDFTVLPDEPFNEENMPPYLLYLTDQFLRENPNAIDDVNKFEFLGIDNAYASQRDIGLGFQVLDVRSSQIRDIENPKRILVHEYEHLQDHIIADEELDVLFKSKDPVLKEYVNRYHELDDHIEVLNKEREKLLEAETEKKDWDQIGDLTDLIKKIRIDQRDIYEGIDEYWYETNPGNPLLQQAYNKVISEGSKRLSKDEEFAAEISTVSQEVKKGILEKLSSLSKEHPEINYDFKDYSEKELYDLTEGLVIKRESSSGGENFVENPYGFDEEIYDELWSLRTQALNNYLLSQKDSDSNLVEKLDDLARSVPDEDIQKRISSLIKAGTGLKYDYAYYNYAPESTIANSRYAEISSTFAELTRNQKLELLNSPIYGDTYRTIFQIGFDSGKISSEEYKSYLKDINGFGECKEPDCCDKKCLIYTFLCEGSCK
ncbi:MAG: hypothetical protein KC516_03435 [Nanoarchaeota archaeon]|nr:hypothetical protein [Nanoarchaeota archaeon]